MGQGAWVSFGGLVLLGLVLAGCGQPDEVDERPSRMIEFVTPEGCALPVAAERQMTGAYLRETEGAGVFDVIILRGLEGTNALAADPRVDDRPVRPRPRGVIGRFINTRPGTATPIARLAGSGGARGYVLEYASDGFAHTGIAVVGETPGGVEVPTAGQLRLSGPVEMILRSADGEDLPVTGVIDAVIGFGSGRGVMRLSGVVAEDGRALPFAEVVWDGLGLCGTRIVSTGQGSVRVTGPEGRIVTPFGRQGAPTAALSTLNGFLTAGADRGTAPAGAGGVIMIQGDAATLRGGFALRSGN